MSKNIDDDVINNFLYMLEDSKKPITQVKVKKNLPPIPRSYEPPINTLTNSRILDNESTSILKENFSHEGLPITLRTSTLRSQAIVYSNKKNDGIHLKVIKRYKLYDEFKQPYNISRGLPSKKETGTPYSMSDGYKDKILIDRTFKNEREAKKFLENMGTMKVMIR